MSNIITLPLSSLRLSAANVRKQHNPEGIEVLAASIHATGLLQNLGVVECEDEPGAYEVAFGGRRFRALTLNRERGLISADHPVDCQVRTRDELETVSLSENVQRESMNPVDELQAWQVLVKQGKTTEQVADAFGVTPLVVERRLALSNASPVLLDLLGKGDISTEQLRALCAVTDHARQESAWNAARHYPTPANLRRIVLGTNVDAAEDRRVAFIGGIEVYKAAGGELGKDLFSGDAGVGLIENVPLLEELVANKLAEHAEAVRAEGWKWVEVIPQVSWNTLQPFGRLQPSIQLDDDQQKRMAELQAKLDDIVSQKEAAMDEDEDETNERHWEALCDQEEEIEQAINELNAEASRFPAEQLAVAGVVVGMEDGKLRIERGLVKAEDRKTAAKAGGDIEGGRETKSAGRKPGGLNNALAKSLEGHRNVAVQGCVAANPRVAKMVLATWVVGQLSHTHGYDPANKSVADLSIHGFGIRDSLHTMGESVAARQKAFAASGEALVKGLPKKGPDLWEALGEYTDEQLDVLIAYGVAMTVNLQEGHKGMTGALLSSLGFDMAEHFEPTVSNYLGRVPKAQVIEALKQAGKADDIDQLQGMKAKALAAEAETRLKGTGWVPSHIRTPAAKPAPKVAAKKTAAKTPAKAKPKAAAKPAKAKTKAKPKGTAAKRA